MEEDDIPTQEDLDFIDDSELDEDDEEYWRLIAAARK